MQAFKTTILALITEKSVLLQALHDKDKQIDGLNEQLTLFKDALAKATSKKIDGMARWTQLQDNWRIAVELGQQQHHDSLGDATAASARSSGPEESRRRLEQAHRLEHLKKELNSLQTTVNVVTSEKQALDYEVSSGCQLALHQEILMFLL